jgi:hypothetical protein
MTDDGPQRAEPGTKRSGPGAYIPDEGDWPCQTAPAGDLPVRAVAFFYRLLRDGAPTPGDVEAHMLQARKHDEDPSYTNCHLEMLARAHVTWLLGGPRTAKRDEQLQAIALVIGATKVEDIQPDTFNRSDIVIAAAGPDIKLLKGDGELAVSRV